MAENYVVVGNFSKAENARGALHKLRELGFDKELEYYAPFPDHHLEDERYKGKKRSPVRRFTLLGGVTGCLSAFLFTTWMSVDYPLRVSAKPLVSVPSFIVIAFECTILLAGIFTLLSMFHFSRIPNILRPAGYNPEFSEGTFGVTVRVTDEKSEAMRTELEKLGAERVEVRYVR